MIMDLNQIYVAYGDKPFEMVNEVLEKINLEGEIKKDYLIGIKPNLVVAKPADQGATTSPELVEGVIYYLKKNGFDRIAILESSWVGENTKRAFKICGYEQISKRYDVPLWDLKEDSWEARRVEDTDIKICKKVLEVDYLINIPVLKAHCQTLLTCALKNLKGCIPDSEKRRFHSLGLNKPIGYLGKAVKCGIIIVDAIAGDLTFEEGGNPVRMDRIIVGKDPVLVDTYGAWLLGYSKDEIEYIGIAERLGVGSANLNKAQIVELNENLKNVSRFTPSGKVKILSQNVTEKNACSACYGSLIHALQRLKEKGKLGMIKDSIYIGQGFRGKPINGIGIGRCTTECAKNINGCPPAAKDILNFLEKIIEGK
jgi:uncharacterized protein (DUF362 family)